MGNPIQKTDESLPMHFVRHDGTEIDYLATTPYLCPTCNPASQGATYVIRFDLGKAVTLLCPHCGFETQAVKNSAITRILRDAEAAHVLRAAQQGR